MNVRQMTLPDELQERFEREIAAFEDLALREMGDLDLLVPPDCVQRSAEIIKKNGYAFIKPFGSVQHLLRTDKQLPPAVKAGVGAVELHWNITSKGTPTNIVTDALWERARPVRLAGTE